MWAEAEADALREMASLGISKSEAARRLGRHPSTVSIHSRRVRLEWTPPPKRPRRDKQLPVGPIPRPWTDVDDRLLTELAAAGVPIGLAANHIDRDYNTTRSHSKQLGLKFERDRKARLRHRDS